MAKPMLGRSLFLLQDRQSMGTYFFLHCRLQARSAGRREALRRPQREERGGGHIVAAVCSNCCTLCLKNVTLVIFFE